MAELTADQWVKKLDAELEARRPRLEMYGRYYDGIHRLAFATSKFRETFGRLFAEFSDNWCELIVDATVERLEVTGFRFGDEESDDDAWRIWQSNDLDAASVIAHTEAIKCGESYALVEPAASPDDLPTITVEHPLQVTVCTSASDRRERLAGWKKWVDDSGYVYGTLYLPDAIIKLQSQTKFNGAWPTINNWVARDGDEGGTNPLGEVPLIPLRNNPTMLEGGRSDLRNVIPMQDAVNKIIADMLVASEFAAFRQRVASGLEIPENMTPDEYRRQFVSEVSRLWVVADENVQWTEFQATDLSNYTGAVETLVQHIAAQTRTPPHYLLGQIVNLSADALKAAETGHIGKVKRRQLDFGDSWETVERLSFKAVGDTAKAAMLDAETLWRDPESRTEAQKADAALKMQALEVPVEFIWEYLGFSPQQIERMLAAREKEAELAAARAPQIVPAAPGVAPGQPPAVSMPQPPVPTA